MQLVFVHGWGFDAGFWDPLCALLTDYKQHKVDLGFYHHPVEFPSGEDCVLVGHSYGFAHAVQKKQDWRALIAINGFLRFVKTDSDLGCVPEAELKKMLRRMGSDPQETLHGFHRRIGTSLPAQSWDAERLRASLEELRITDVSHTLESFKVPSLILASRHDPLIPVEASAQLGSIMPQNKLLWRETGGHVLPVSDPDWCATAIRDFMQSHFG